MSDDKSHPIVDASGVTRMSNNLVAEQTTSSSAVRPFHVNFSDADLEDMRKRIKATRWPSRETVKDDSQGVPLDVLAGPATYWGTDYDWRKCEAKLNALPQCITEIDGSTFISFTFAPNMKMRCRLSSRTGGPARSSSS